MRKNRQRPAGTAIVLLLAAAAFLLAVERGAALGLLEERGEDAEEGDDQREAEQADAGGTPERDVARRARLLGDVGEGERCGDQRENAQRGGEDVEVASHRAGLRIARVDMVECELRSTRRRARRIFGIAD